MLERFFRSNTKLAFPRVLSFKDNILVVKLDTPSIAIVVIGIDFAVDANTYDL